MFCSECGLEIKDKSILYCPECGTMVEWEEEAEEVVEAVPEPADEPAEESVKSGSGDDITGIIFTNVDLLAKHLSADRKAVLDVINGFIFSKASYGVHYRLVDAGNYTYRKRGFLGRTKTVRLDLDSSLWEYMDVLMDAHDPDAEEIEYMFIIGGDEVIPMPCIAHYVPGITDKDIDTDLVYSYPYGPEMAEAIADQTFFTYQPLYHVGRLPMPLDAGFNELAEYLARAAACSDGVPLGYAYGQCDPNWKLVSTVVSSVLDYCGLMLDYSSMLTEDYCHKGLILSPMVKSGSVGRVFNTKAGIYYFNLHGGRAKESRGYFGESVDKTWSGVVIQPENMMTCEQPNIAFSEACYGGRFIGLDKRHSMMMSSIFNMTMTFVGSSRVAWGNVDGGASSADQVGTCCADDMASTYLRYMLMGATSAEALYMARAVVLNSGSPGDPYAAATATEFNLYGDPSTKLKLPDGQEKQGKAMESTLVKKGTSIGCNMKNVSEKPEGSILEQVRGAVDANLRQIRSMVDEYLYSNYKVTPRQLDGIFSAEYANGEKVLFFNYDLADDKEFQSKMTVATGMSGEVKKIYASKLLK